MYLLRNLPFVTESPPLLPIRSLFSHSSSFSFAISSARGAEEEDEAQLRSVAVLSLLFTR
jgi:hypothetical protein